MNSIEILKAFIHRIDTQDSLCTAKPIQFLLQTPEEIVVDGDYRYDKIQYYHSDFEDHAVNTEREAREWWKECGYEADEIEKKMLNLNKLYIKQIWRTEQAFLTREGVDRHLGMNLHNYRKGHRVYVVHAFRDPEMKEIYDAIRDVVTQNQAYQEITVQKEG